MRAESAVKVHLATAPAPCTVLPADRVNELVSSGVGQPFAPAGRSFKEWVTVTDRQMWEELVHEARAFVSANAS